MNFRGSNITLLPNTFNANWWQRERAIVINPTHQENSITATEIKFDFDIGGVAVFSEEEAQQDLFIHWNNIIRRSGTAPADAKWYLKTIVTFVGGANTPVLVDSREVKMNVRSVERLSFNLNDYTAGGTKSIQRVSFRMHYQDATSTTTVNAPRSTVWYATGMALITDHAIPQDVIDNWLSQPDLLLDANNFTTVVRSNMRTLEPTYPSASRSASTNFYPQDFPYSRVKVSPDGGYYEFKDNILDWYSGNTTETPTAIHPDLVLFVPYDPDYSPAGRRLKFTVQVDQIKLPSGPWSFRVIERYSAAAAYTIGLSPDTPREFTVDVPLPNYNTILFIGAAPTASMNSNSGSNITFNVESFQTEGDEYEFRLYPDGVIVPPQDVSGTIPEAILKRLLSSIDLSEQELRNAVLGRLKAGANTLGVSNTDALMYDGREYVSEGTVLFDVGDGADGKYDKTGGELTGVVSVPADITYTDATLVRKGKADSDVGSIAGEVALVSTNTMAVVDNVCAVNRAALLADNSFSTTMVIAADGTGTATVMIGNDVGHYSVQVVDTTGEQVGAFVQRNVDSCVISVVGATPAETLTVSIFI